MDFPSVRCPKCGKTLCYCDCPKKCSKCGQPTFYCKCYATYKQKEENIFDVSFQAYPIEVTYDMAKKDEKSSQEGATPKATVEDENDLFNLDNFQLTDLYFDNKGKEKEEEINKKINKYRYFYLTNDKFWSISLKNKDLYKSYKENTKFIGNKFKEILEDDNDLALMVQLVNERSELKAIGKYLFYREIYLHTYRNNSIRKLFVSYVGGDEEQFIFDERENVRYYRWKFLVHRNRLEYVSELLKTNFSVSLEIIKTIKSYDDVLKYFLKH